MKLEITKEEREGLKNTFKNFGRKKSDEEIFYDLCFCICAPQTTFKSNHKVVAALQYLGFYDNDVPKTTLLKVVKPARFFRNKTKYLIAAKKEFEIIKNHAVNTKHQDSFKKRTWLVKNVKGLGMKAASHFLRNLGDIQLAIIDVHILKFLERSIPRNNNEYILFEIDFCKIAKENKLTAAELDALVWQRYSNTPWEEFKY